MNGSFVAQDMILFFVFFEVVLLPMYFLIGVWGGEDRRYASLKFFLYTLFGSALMIISFLALFFLSKDASGELLQTFDMRILTDVAGVGIIKSTQVWIFAGLFMGFGIKVPMFPFHTWLPDAHTQAPTVGSVILAAVLLKLGTYGFVRIAIPFLPEGAIAWAPWIGLLLHWHHLRRRMSRTKRYEAPHSVLLSSSHGFRNARNSYSTDFGINAAIFGNRPRAHYRNAVLRCRFAKERYHTLEISRLGAF